ncbi:MAG: leucine-rich repeat protein [Ruminiclostridium sp.]|nr:leucine-rich repeat protein [Ruminiclostridium sp.]
MIIGTAVTSISLPASVTTVDEYAFHGADKLTTVTFAKSKATTLIYQNAFKDCKNLTNVSLPDGAVVRKGAFDGCPNVKVTYKGKTYTQKNMSSLYS